MNGLPKSFKLASFTTAVLFLITSSGAVSLEAGEISETDVNRAFVSERWIGLSGEVFRSNETLEDSFIQNLRFNSSQSGTVLETKLKGIKNGGFYIAYLPKEKDIQPDLIKSLNKTDLQKNGILSQKLYPSFYGNYSEQYDSPTNTFEESSEIKVEGELYQAFKADLSGKADTYLLEYDEGDSELPIILSPIDGLTRGSNFSSCYVKGCNFQTLLPVLGNSTYSYSTYLLPTGNSVSSCGKIASNSTNLLLGDLGSESENCIEIEDANNTYLDFYNSVIENKNSCGITVSDSVASISGATTQDTGTGICAEDSNLTLNGGSFSKSNQGIDAEKSNINLNNVSLAQNSLDANLGNSNITAKNLTLRSTSINMEGSSIGINSVETDLPRPSQAGQNQLPLDLQVEINDRSGDSEVTSLGLSFPINASSEFRDMYLYKYDTANSSFNISRLGPLARQSGVAWYNKTIEEFSSFSLYGVEADDESDQDDSEGSQGGGSSGGGSSGGGSSGGGSSGGGSSGGGSSGGGSSGGGSSGGGSSGGGSSGGGFTSFDPVRETPQANLTVEPESYNALKGETVSIRFRVNNTGNISIQSLNSGLVNNTFSDIPREFQSLSIGETRQGRILATVPENLESGNISLDAMIQSRNFTLDTDQFTVNVSERTQEKDLDIAESPSFARLSPNESRSIAFLVENPTNRDLEGIKARIRGEDNCVALNNQVFDISAGEQKSIQTVFNTVDQEQVCNPVVVFSHEEDILAYNPMRIAIGDRQRNFQVPFYIILLMTWSTLLLYRVIGNRR